MDSKKLCNQQMTYVRQTIEHCYDDIPNIFLVCNQDDSIKLGLKDADETCCALQQLRLCHLLMNIYVCLNGNKASSYTKFNCLPPKLKDYLALELFYIIYIYYT